MRCWDMIDSVREYEKRLLTFRKSKPTCLFHYAINFWKNERFGDKRLPVQETKYNLHKYKSFTGKQTNMFFKIGLSLPEKCIL